MIKAPVSQRVHLICALPNEQTGVLEYRSVDLLTRTKHHTLIFIVIYNKPLNRVTQYLHYSRTPSLQYSKMSLKRVISIIRDSAQTQMLHG